MRETKNIVKHKNGNFQVMVWISGVNNYVGLYKTFEEAVIARDTFLKKNSKMNTSLTYENRYVDNKEMLYEMIISQAAGILSPKLMMMSLKIVKGVSKKFRYKEPEDKYDCECYAIEMVIKNWYMFDLDNYDNVFAWVTQVVKNGFAMQFKILQKSRQDTISLDYTFNNGKSLQNYI
jgi:hypothetical protein